MKFAKSFLKNKIFVATDNLKIKKIVEREAFKAILIKRKCLTGTDRVLRLLKKLDLSTL